MSGHKVVASLWHSSHYGADEWPIVLDFLVYKFNTESKMVKIQFESTAMANRTAKDVIIILNQRILARRIEKEIFVKLMLCNNCYGYDHETKNCTKEKLALCVYCGEEGHKQNNWRSETPRCLNCSRAHRMLVAQCRIRKDLIKSRKKEIH